MEEVRWEMDDEKENLCNQTSRKNGTGKMEQVRWKMGDGKEICVIK